MHDHPTSLGSSLQIVEGEDGWHVHISRDMRTARRDRRRNTVEVHRHPHGEHEQVESLLRDSVSRLYPEERQRNYAQGLLDAAVEHRR